MKRKKRNLVLMILICLVLAGCGNSGQGESITSQTSDILEMTEPQQSSEENSEGIREAAEKNLDTGKRTVTPIMGRRILVDDLFGSSPDISFQPIPDYYPVMGITVSKDCNVYALPTFSIHNGVIFELSEYKHQDAAYTENGQLKEEAYTLFRFRLVDSDKVVSEQEQLRLYRLEEDEKIEVTPSGSIVNVEYDDEGVLIIDMESNIRKELDAGVYRAEYGEYMVDFRMRRVEGDAGYVSFETSPNTYDNEPDHLSSGSVILVANSVRWICD